MATEKLYEQDAYQRTFSARVLECRQNGAGWIVVLDRTCFYPEGGGQPGDRGALGGVRVTDTREEAGEIFHCTDGPLEPEAEVAGEIDWAWRFDLMQQHSGEHMVSGVVHSRFGYDNVGFHMGAEMITIDFSGILTEQQLREVEEAVNREIWLDKPVRCWYPDPAELQALSYRSKKALTGPVRVVEFPGVDLCACCGTHVARTGEIGLVKILSTEKFHSGVRVEMLSGRRAYEYVVAALEQNRRISQLLSAKVLETAAAVENQTAELEVRKQRCYGLETSWFQSQAEACRGVGDVFLQMEDLTPDGVRRAAIALQETCGGRAAVFSGDDESGYKYAVGLPDGDLRSFVKDLNSALNGRGGGKPNFVQGSVCAKWDEIAAFMSGR